MALSISTVWEVRPTVGSDVAGGGFVAGASGTDFSQQDSKNTVGNNISTTDAVANGTTTVTSATASFTSAIVGNIIHINGAWYQVVTFTNATTIVVDRTITTASGLTMNIGGALATISQAVTNLVGGNIVYIKATGSYSVTATQNLTSTQAGSGNNITSFIGYTTTRGDGGMVTWTTATNSIALVTFAQCNNFLFQNIKFSSTAGTRGNGLTAGTSGVNANLVLINCLFDGLNVAVNGPHVGTFHWAPLTMIGCEVKNSVGIGVLNAYSIVMDGCYIHDNGGNGVQLNNSGDNHQSASFANTVFYNNTGNGLTDNGGGNNSFIFIKNCAFVSNTSTGFSETIYASVVNTIFDSNGGFGISVGSAVNLYQRDNAFRANTSGKYSSGVPAGAGEVVLTASPFNNVPTDFGLNSTSGGGAACKGAGYPSAIPGG